MNERWENVVTRDEVESLVEFEKAIQWRWSTGDPTGYMDVLAEDVTYFDPLAEHLLVGRAAVLEHWKRIYADAHITRQEYLNEVSRASVKGDEVLLAFNFNTYQQDDNGEEKPFLSWDMSLIFRKIADKWMMAHGHLSLSNTLDLDSIRK